MAGESGDRSRVFTEINRRETCQGFDEEKKSKEALYLRSKLVSEVCSDEGKMVEWSITPVLKTGELKGSGGSNPSLSAKKT